MVKLKLIKETRILSIYSPIIGSEEYSEFEKFLLANRNGNSQFLQSDFDSIIAAINKMTTIGARENLLRPEGRMGRNIKAIPLLTIKRPKGQGTLRLYCIRLNDSLIILGNGGIKTTQTYQSDPILLGYVRFLKNIESEIFKKTRKSNIDYEDTNAMKEVIKSLNIEE